MYSNWNETTQPTVSLMLIFHTKFGLNAKFHPEYSHDQIQLNN